MVNIAIDKNTKTISELNLIFLFFDESSHYIRSNINMQSVHSPWLEECCKASTKPKKKPRKYQ